MKNKKTLSFIVAFALMVSAATLLISATSALGSGSYAIRFSAEREGGAGYYREASVIGGSASGKYLVFQVTSGEAEDAAVTVTAIQLSGTSSAIISYQKPDSFVEAWLAEGLPDLAGGGELGTDILAYNNSDTPEPPEPTPTPYPDVDKDPELIKVTRSMLGADGGTTGQYAKFPLFDEYDHISYPPDAADGYKPPVDGSAAVNLNVWRTGGNASDWSASPTVNVNFGRYYKLLEIYIYDGPTYAPSTLPAHGAPFEVQGGKFYVYDGDTLLAEYTSANSGEWVKFEVPDNTFTDRLRFVKQTSGELYSWYSPAYGEYRNQFLCDVCIPEVSLYGIPVGDDPIIVPTPTPEPVPDPQEPDDFDITFGEFVGTNGFFQQPADDYAAVGFVREYHTWGWTEYAVGDAGNGGVSVNTANPRIAMIDPWGGVFTTFYRAMQARNVQVDICIQTSVNGTAARPNWQGTRDSEDPASYYAHGASMFQHAARYGSNANVDPSLLKTEMGLAKQAGLGLIKYFENWNEPNSSWSAPDFRFTANEFAAMLSADYDGHMGTMGRDVGVKQADPDAKLVMGGLVGLSTDFVLDMNRWFRVHRSETEWLKTHDTLDGYQMYPYDVINLHYYCPDTGFSPTGLSPEADNLVGRIQAVVDWRNRYYPQAEIWLSEFGWDTTQGTPQSATVEYTDDRGILHNQGVNPGLTGQEVQGRWLVREYILLSAAGIDRAQQFMLGDDNSDGFGRFNTCGMIGKYGKKTSWYYVGTMKYYLNTTKYEKQLETGRSDVLAYQFKEADPDKEGDRAIAIWATTTSDQKIPGYSLTLPEGTTSARLVTLKDGVKWGEVKDIPVVGGAVVIEVSERPVFVLTSSRETDAPPEPDFEGVRFLFKTTFDRLKQGALSATNSVIDMSYHTSNTRTPEVIMPDSSSPLYVGPGDQVLKVYSVKDLTDRGTVEFLNNDKGTGVIISSDITRQMLPGHTYYLDYSFQVERTTTIPFARFDGGNWTRLWVWANPVGGNEPGVLRKYWDGFITFEANRWYRLVSKIEIQTTTGPNAYHSYLVSQTLYCDDMTHPKTIELNYSGFGDPYGVLEIGFTPWLNDGTGTNTARGVGYLNNLFLYESEHGIIDLENPYHPPVPDPSLIYDAKINEMSLGAMASGTNSLNIYTIANAPDGFAPVVEAVTNDKLYYEKPGEQVLKFPLEQLGVDYYGNAYSGGVRIDSSAILSKIQQGEIYSLDYKLWIDRATTVPIIKFGFNNWFTFAPVCESWHAYNRLGGVNQYLYNTYSMPVARWNDLSLRFRLNPASAETGGKPSITVQLYVNDMDNPLTWWKILWKENDQPNNASQVIKRDATVYETAVENILQSIIIGFSIGDVQYQTPPYSGAGYIKDLTISGGAEIQPDTGGPEPPEPDVNTPFDAKINTLTPGGAINIPGATVNNTASVVTKNGVSVLALPLADKAYVQENPLSFVSINSADAIAALKSGDAYVLDYKIWNNEAMSTPVLRLQYEWGRTAIIDNQWSAAGVYGVDGRWTRTLEANRWNRIAVVMTLRDVNKIDYAVYINDMETPVYTVTGDTTMQNISLLSRIDIQLWPKGDMSGQTYQYLKDLSVYKGPAIRNVNWENEDTPVDYVVNVDLGGFAPGSAPTMAGASFDSAVTVAEIEGAKVLSLNLAGKDNFSSSNAVSFTGSGIIGQIETGKPYVIDYKVFLNEALSAPTLTFRWNNWETSGFLGGDWGAGIISSLPNGGSYVFTAQQWHHIALKFTITPEGPVEAALYIDDMDVPVYEGNNIINHNGIMNISISQFAKGNAAGLTTVYVKDVSIYRGSAIK